MECSVSGEGPAILQLHKWAPSKPQLDLSEFREAFISPTRELILLLSYQCEALLLPLIIGELLTDYIFDNCILPLSDFSIWLLFVFGEHSHTHIHACICTYLFIFSWWDLFWLLFTQLLCYYDFSFDIFWSAGENVDSNIAEGNDDGSRHGPYSYTQARSDSKDDTPCTSGSATDFDNGFSNEHDLSRLNYYPFVCDVNSLAWGIGADTYNQHHDALFRELLFVSGDQRVTVHAFCHSNDTGSMTRSATQADNFGQGRWVEWGPFSLSTHNVDAEEISSLSCRADVPENVEGVHRTNGNNEICHSIHIESGNDDGSRRWLRSFFTKAETTKSDGGVWTRFPQKSSFPSSANVVSFTLFDSNLPFQEVSPNENSCSDKNRQESALNVETHSATNSQLDSSSVNFQSDVLINYLGIDNKSSYKCTRVFSSCSHFLIGFVLRSVGSLLVNIGGERETSESVVVVSQLNSWGIKWVSAVKLEEGSDWIDFCFSDNLLVCLNTSGLVSCYVAMSGSYATQLNVLHTCRLDPGKSLQAPNRSFKSSKRDIKQVDEGMPTREKGGIKFKRLIVASYTSLLSVVDEFGVIYVICIADHIRENYNHIADSLPHFPLLGLGLMVGWKVGGSAIDHQRPKSKSITSGSSGVSSERYGSVSIFDNVGSKLIHEWQEQRKWMQYDLSLNGFSAASKKSEQSFDDCEIKLRLMRKFFLPSDRFGKDDFIYFSSLGITRLSQKHNILTQKNAQIIHIDLHTNLAVSDDSTLNSGSSPWRKESTLGVAVGCSFQGSFYLVTEDGVSVVLPAVAIPSNFLPVETIGYRQPRLIEGIGFKQKRKNAEIEELKQPWSPWKVEILDRVLVFEGPEEADHLCLENGEYISSVLFEYILFNLFGAFAWMLN